MDPIESANFSPLTHAAAIGDHSTVLFLLETGSDPEQMDSDGSSALSLAVQSGCLKSVAYLLEYGANPERIDSAGKSPMQIALDRNLTEMKSLLSGAAAVHRDREVSPKRRKQERSHPRSRWSAIPIAALYILAIGLAVGAYQMRVMFKDNTSQAVFDAIDSNNVSQVSRFLLNGISPNIRNSNGKSALLYASNTGRLDIVRLLLKNHADPNLGTSQGISALSGAGIEHREIVEALLESGADPNRKDAIGRSLLCWACATDRYSNLVDLLLKHGSNPNLRADNGTPLVMLIEGSESPSPTALKALLDTGADPNAADSASTPVLVWAAGHSSSETVKMLLAGGAKLTAVDSLGRTSLDAACARVQDDIVRMLLDRGANPNTPDHEGNTSVMYAVSGLVDGPESGPADCTAILRLLAKAGARMDTANKAGKTPSQLATSLGVDENLLL